ncbi:Type VI secretion system, lysozyme-related protein [Candidatus Magnetomorum sp. HK-1]|nr:Type VI secretion system, lysozyme-related protein [Candidatus Magnetomorum sp. HK-1]
MNPPIRGLKTDRHHDLFEALLGRPLCENKHNAPGLAWSIRNHLKMLLNSKSAFLNYLPDYGLPDISEIYENVPDSLDLLARIIEKVIRKFEPRLKNVRVSLINKVQEDRFQATYLVESEIDPEGQITFQTQLNANGEIEIIEGE